MVERIQWSNYTGNDFQLFCNALLTFEIGNKFIPYTAPGSDQGFDGKYTGSYSDKSGLWRFQYKLHTIARKQGFDALKSDIKKDIPNITNENHLVFITNVELRPNEITEIIQLFEEQTRKLANQPTFELWDGAKIFSLYLKYPILQLWLTDGFNSSQIVNYKEYFKNSLATSSDAPFTLNNYFVARESEITSLKNFLKSDKSVALVTGEAGIGKTRLVLELFRQIENEEDYATNLILISQSIDFDKLAKGLSGSANFNVLVDDAHELTSNGIASLIHLSKTLSPRVKFIFTARKLQSTYFTEELNPFDQLSIESIELSALTREQTKKLFEKELKENYLIDYLDDLIKITHGKPILIVAILRSATLKTSIQDITKEKYFNQYVKQYFQNLCIKINQETKISISTAKYLIQLICLIEPINFNDQNIIEKISSHLNVERREVIHALGLMQKGNYVTGRYLQGIKPDFYSDIILSDTDSNNLKEAIQTFIIQISNIITNLSAADEVSGAHTSLLDEILNVYVNLVKEDQTPEFITTILETVSDITYSKPSFAMQSVSKYLDLIQNKDSKIYKEITDKINYNIQAQNSSIVNVKNILRNLLYKAEHYTFVFDSLLRVQSLPEVSKALINIYELSRRDYLENYSCKRQIYFANKIKILIDSSRLSDETLSYLIEACQSCMILEFNHSAWSSIDHNQIILSTYYIPAKTSVKKLRKMILQAYFSAFQKVSNYQIRDRIVQKLLDFIREILRTRKNKTPYKGEDEIELILNFIAANYKDIPLLSQKEIIEKFYWFRKWEINSSFYPKLVSIENLLTPKNATEDLIQLFSKKTIAEITAKNTEDAFNNLSSNFIDKYNEVQIAEALINIIKIQDNNLYFFITFLRFLTKEFSSKSQVIFNELWIKDKGFIHQYGNFFLQTEYFTHKNSEFYWQKVNAIIAEESPSMDLVILAVYGSFHSDYINLTSNDINILGNILIKKEHVNNPNALRALIVYIVHSPSIGTKLAYDYLQECTPNSADYFFLFLSDNLTNSYQKVKEIITNGSLRFSITYNIEKNLNKILQVEGIDALMQYFIARYEYSQRAYNETGSILGHEFAPNTDHSCLYDEVEDIVVQELFSRALRWYIHLNGDRISLFIAKDLIDYLKPQESISDLVFDVIHATFEDSKTNRTALARILEIISFFHSKDERLIDFALQVYNAAEDLPDPDPENSDSLFYNLREAITAVGVKTGTPGQPFQVDIDLKNMLEKKLAALEEYDPNYSIIKGIINSVSRSINDIENEIGNDIW